MLIVDLLALSLIHSVYFHHRVEYLIRERVGQHGYNDQHFSIFSHVDHVDRINMINIST